VFERFTEASRRAVTLAQDEARLLDHDDVGTEHLLLGLVHEGEGLAAQALGLLGVTLDGARRQVEQLVGRGSTPPVGPIPFARPAKRALELSLREALQLGNNYIGTEHLLLGLIRDGAGVAIDVLTALGVDMERLRTTVLSVRASQGPITLPEPNYTPATMRILSTANIVIRTPVGSDDVLRAMLADPDSRASKALAALGVTLEAVERALADIPPEGTSDDVRGSA
jgi:ATP-dependent Clp protease ATP-binding subunit ClpA